MFELEFFEKLLRDVGWGAVLFEIEFWLFEIVDLRKINLELFRFVTGKFVIDHFQFFLIKFCLFKFFSL